MKENSLGRSKSHDNQGIGEEILLKLMQANCHKMRKRLKVSDISIISIYSKSSCRKALMKAPGSRSPER